MTTETITKEAIDNSTVALRFNDGKIDYTMLDFDALKEAAKVMMKGAKKYSKDNWKKPCPDKSVHLQSAMRHLIDIINGNEFDVESGELNAAHLICNAMMYIHHLKKEQMVSQK